IHIKSKLLLPKAVEEEEPEEEDDPRAELVRRLLEYQKYKEAACDLDQYPQLERDLFARVAPEPEVLEESEGGFVAIGLFDLLAALQDVLRESPEPSFHQVDLEQLSVTDRINSILGQLHGQHSLAFGELFPQGVQRNELVVTFLAMLELVKMRMVRLMQNSRFGTIWLHPAVTLEDDQELALGDDSLGYS
ncbi:MAG: segregation/condensation protein A, partial [Desulfuromonas sp.]